MPPAMAPLHPWRWPEQPWERIHIYFAEKVNSLSKWLEVVLMSSIERKGPINYLVQVGQRQHTVHGVLEIPNTAVNVDDMEP